MPNYNRSGKVRVSLTPPPLTLQKDQIETEVKYFGLERDLALFDIEQPSKALAEVLKDIQDPAEASVEGLFIQQDLEVIDGVTRYNLKNEDFKVLENSSLNVEDSAGASTALVNPRQRISDRLKQLEVFAGRGKVYQGQGTTMYKYLVPTDELDGPPPLGRLYSHTNPPPFFTYDLNDPITTDHPDFIPVTSEEIESTHRVGYLENGVFVPQKEEEWWWSGEYNREEREREQYGDVSRTLSNDPQFPIVKDGNISFRYVKPQSISAEENWGIRLDTWFKKDFSSNRDWGRFAAKVGGHLRIDYFEKQGYDVDGNLYGIWRTALDTTDPDTYFIQESRESSLPGSTYGYSRTFVQGGPSTNYGASNHTSSDYTTRVGLGGAFERASTYVDREGNNIPKFDDEYVPVVIRFWYGQQDTSTLGPDPTPTEFLESAPSSFPYFLLDFIESTGVTEWNDYSTRIRARWNSTDSEWVVQSEVDAGDSNLDRMNGVFEVYAYKATSTHPDKSGGVVGSFNPDNWVVTNTYIGGERVDPVSTNFKVSLPGFSPTNDQDVWFVIRNRPLSGIPYENTQEELWQQYLFDPSNDNPFYSSIEDMIEGMGENYKEPDPKKVTFDENPDYYKSKLGKLPALNTYGPDRYDGMLRLEITDSNTDRDYDYTHSKSLFIGRQKKSESVKALAPGEVRLPGENYTFINVISDSNGNGGRVIINAFPENNMGILSAGSSGTFGKALNLADNTSTYSNPNRQNLSTLVVNKSPLDAVYDNVDLNTKRAFKYIVSSARAGEAYLYRVDGNDVILTTSTIATEPWGTADGLKNHNVKTLFISSYRSGSNSYNFYGLIGAVRESVEAVQITTPSSAPLNVITSAELFPDLIGSNTNAYNGTYIEYRTSIGGAIVAEGRVTSYDTVNKRVTVTLDSGSLSSNTAYYVDIWYNFLKTTAFPTNVVSSTGSKIINNLTSGSNIQISFTHNGSYQYSRVDNGAGLSFSETLFIDGDDDDPNTSESNPFKPGTEAPAPPAEIVTPFGYDNKPSSSDKGLGGLCYPPYSTQNINLLPSQLSSTELEAKPTGQYDVWWGSTQPGQTTNLSNRYLEVTNKLLFDFKDSNRSSLITTLSNSNKPNFSSASTIPYSHKLEVELSVEVPAGDGSNSNLYADVINYSNGKPVKDRYFLFVNKNGSDLEVLVANSTSPW